MSFVSIIAMEKYINVMSDGLVVNLETKETKQGNYKKFEYISPNQFIAFAGNLGLCEKAVEVTGYHEESVNLKQLADELQKEIYNVKFEEATVLLAVGGLNQDGDIEFHSFSNNPDQKMLSFNPKNDDVAYSFLHQGIDGIDLDEKFQNYLRRTGFRKYRKAFEAQELLNNFVASVDDTVNRRINKLNISK